MDNHLFVDIIKYIIPIVGMLVLVYFFLENWRKQEIFRANLQLQKDYKALILPTRVQAFERMVLFLERISPSQLIMRLNNSELTAREFQYILTKEITEEFEHNLSQQLYIPTESWNIISLAKDQVIQQIIQASQQLPPDAKARDLAMVILNQNISNTSKLPTADAIEVLKKDFSNLIKGYKNQ